MTKLRIAIDIDDVLSANAEGFVRFSNERWGTNLTVEDYDEHWGELWKVEHDEVERRAVEFHTSGVVAHYRHDAWAKSVLQRLREHFDLVVVTSRRRLIVKETEAWLERYFSEVHYAGMWDTLAGGRYTMTKAEMCREIGADYLVDDQLKHCLAAAEAGIPAVLFGDYTWNQAESLPERVTRCRDWGEVEAYFEALL